MACGIKMETVIIQKVRCQILLGVRSFRHLALEAKMVMPSQREVIRKKAALLILHLGLLLGLLLRRYSISDFLFVLIWLCFTILISYDHEMYLYLYRHFNICLDLLQDYFRRDSKERDLQSTDVPSAPPFQQKSQEMKQELDGTVASRKCSIPVSAPLDASNVSEGAFSNGNMHVEGGNNQPGECIRSALFCHLTSIFLCYFIVENIQCERSRSSTSLFLEFRHAAADTDAPHNSGSFPARLPTFHARLSIFFPLITLLLKCYFSVGNEFFRNCY